MTIITNPKIKLLDKKGQPIVGGRMYVYEAGTDSPEWLFADKNLSNVLPNPVITDEYGDFPVCYSDNKNYKLIFKDEKENLLYTLDNVNFFNNLEEIIKIQQDGTIEIDNSENYERNIVFRISNYSMPTGLDILTLDATTGEIKTYEDYEDNVSDDNTLITKGYVEKYPPLPMDYIARLPVSFTENSITVGMGVCKASNNIDDIRVSEPITINLSEETVYAFMEGSGSITLPSETTARVLLVAGGGAGGGWDEQTLSPTNPTTIEIL